MINDPVVWVFGSLLIVGLLVNLWKAITGEDR